MCHDSPVQDEADRCLPLPILALIGAAAGILSGMFGVGGGVVMVPALAMAGRRQSRAQSASLAAIVPIAAVGAVVFGGADSVDFAAAGILVIGSIVGARGGALLSHRISDQRLTWLFAGFLIVVAITMLIG